jgi:hypothetical protein
MLVQIDEMNLEELRDRIRQVKAAKGDYQHNLIAMLLGTIDTKYGEAEARKAIDDFDLGL